MDDRIGMGLYSKADVILPDVSVYTIVGGGLNVGIDTRIIPSTESPGCHLKNIQKFFTSALPSFVSSNNGPMSMRR
jgi:hypothetical protein